MVVEGFSPVLKPMIKYRGGKSRELSHLLEWVPDTFDRYIEPFFGGGALYFALAPPKKHRNFDTMGIKVAVLSFCPKALISRGFWLLSAPAATR